MPHHKMSIWDFHQKTLLCKLPVVPERAGGLAVVFTSKWIIWRLRGKNLQPIQTFLYTIYITFIYFHTFLYVCKYLLSQSMLSIILKHFHTHKLCDWYNSQSSYYLLLKTINEFIILTTNYKLMIIESNLIEHCYIF